MRLRDISIRLKLFGQIADGASRQCAATEQSTAAMEEMAASVRHNAEHAVRADQLAAKASTDAQSSGTAVTETCLR
jgi:methyl-accepting chemotaxis protein